MITFPHFGPDQCLMCPDEQIALWSVVIALAPRCVLEIGSYKGGSALLICRALDMLASPARLFMVDPCDHRDPALWAQIAPRATFINEFSPAGIATAFARAGSLFDLVFVDGDHHYDPVRADIDGLLPYLTPGASILFHDAHHAPVRRAIEDALAVYPLRDKGVLAGEILGTDPENQWGGIRQVVYDVCR